MKTVVLYYSRTRKTALAAKTLAKGVEADEIEFIDLKDRMGALNYMIATIDALRENKTEIKPDSVDISDYGLVYIGTPTWGGKPAPAVISLIDRCDLQGKDVILFATMGSKGGESVIKRMREKIEARGGRMVNSFVITTSNKSSEEIKEDVESMVEAMDLKLYGI
ncbi:flavodoxin family protein [Methanobacterium aggregans]|uniref:flavodoxin family protein n=1 Tax=Methanobacterium aggregans TaxID=1615586 RepID=UPI001AE10F03|nr:flavodoxin domain-containing protein [Methanobacterium aggregans]MBP2045041.1 flavodoxin [Methanobacterium aggregans]